MMKKVTAYIFLSVVSLLLTSCLETTEDLTVTNSGSGNYQTHINLSGLFEFMDMMKSMDTSGSAVQKPIPVLDTLIYLKSLTDTASNLTKEEKVLMREATMHVAINEKARLFTIDMKFPYSKLSEVEKIITINQSNPNFIGKALKGKTNLPEDNEQQTPTMPDVSSVYDIVYQNGKLERKINTGRWQKFQSDESFAMLLQMKDMFATSFSNTVIHLPKPAKKAEGAQVQLSGDKKTVTIKANFAEIFDHPEILSYHIEY